MRRSAQAERDLVRLADALNAFGMTVEDYGLREMQSARARLEAKQERRAEKLYRAARKLREDVAPIIERIDP